MPVRFTCTECHQTLSVGRRKIGSEVTCPRCQATVVVPTREQGGIVQTLGRITEPAHGGIDTLPELIVYDDVPRIVAAPPRTYTGPAVTDEELPYDPNLVAVPRRALYMQAVVIAVLAIVAFILGYLLGLGSKPPPKPAPTEPMASATIPRALIAPFDTRAFYLQDELLAECAGRSGEAAWGSAIEHLKHGSQGRFHRQLVTAQGLERG